PQPKALEEPFPGATEPGEDKRRQFFEFAGPLFSVAISPVSSIVRVGATKELRALPRDRSRRRVEEDLEFHWQLVEGPGQLTGVHNQAVTFLAPEEPGLARVRVTVRQREVVCVGEGLVTVTHELLTQFAPTMVPSQGLPGYTLERAPGESWRSKFDIKRNVIVVNNGHRDFVFASRSKSLKLRYLMRLYAKGAGHAQFRRLVRRPVARTNGRAFFAHRRAPLGRVVRSMECRNRASDNEPGVLTSASTRAVGSSRRCPAHCGFARKSKVARAMRPDQDHRSLGVDVAINIIADPDWDEDRLAAATRKRLRAGLGR